MTRPPGRPAAPSRPRLYHVSEDGPLTIMSPRPSPPGTPYEGREWVWAVDERRLPHYLVPRQCPRVCWATPAGSRGVLSSPAARVVVVEHAWANRLVAAGLKVHDLEPHGFTLLDATAGYWVTGQRVRVHGVRQVDDCFTALAEHDVELRLTPSLWPYVDAVVAASVEFSNIRMRNAQPRP
ncbi:DUF6886 family protein [Actinoplanes sp. NPDC051475]|uniref:DUF6886 family protein n=1 Tax=Actinoplanes sp. NPDC051475 TaxID=3157225 RepID=UPI00344F885C